MDGPSICRYAGKSTGQCATISSNDFATYGGIGCQLTRNIFSEVGYRLLYTDYDTTSLVYQVVMHGAQITVGLTF